MVRHPGPGRPRRRRHLLAAVLLRPRLSRLPLPQRLRHLAHRRLRVLPPAHPQPACALPVPTLPLARQGVLLPVYHHVDHDGNPLSHGRHRVAVSGDVAFDSARPDHVHLAFADRVDEMRVMFVCADGGKRVVRYRPGKERKDWKEVATEVRTYEQKHMCDSPANGSVGWRDPGFVFDAS
ncbi:hypothetical protein ABZP36_001436 [Zizania latifolia]